MTRGRVAAAVALVCAFPTVALSLIVCPTPNGGVAVTSLLNEDRLTRVLSVLHASGTIADPATCWNADLAMLPARVRPDPRNPGESLTQRHRWRHGLGNTVVLDPSVKRPHREAIAREIRRALGPDRMAALVAAPAGDHFFRAVREGDWALARSLLRRAVADSVITLDEARAIRAVARDYEADLEEGSP